MMSGSDEVIAAIFEMRDLLRLLAGPAIAERDKKAREDIRLIAGQGEKKQAAIMLMDGSKTQAEIVKETGIQKGNLSIVVKKLSEVGVLIDDIKRPKLKIFLPPNFFEMSKL